MKNIIWGILVIIAVGFIYYSFNPSIYTLFPKCPFLALTGLQCPGCGSQRAVHSLLHLDIRNAFGYNALLVVSLPIIALLLYAELNRKKRPVLYFKIHNAKYIWSYFIIVVFWFITRNIFHL